MRNPFDKSSTEYDAYEMGYAEGLAERKAAPKDFEAFWKAYPRRVGKGAALKAWKSQKPELTEVLAALQWQRKQDAWTKDGGQYIPHPATWLNAQRWFDEDPNAHKNNFKHIVRQKPEDDGPMPF